jgi:hypothetical protein
MAAAEDLASTYLFATERLYESLEYERALVQVAQARRLPRTLAEDVRIALFEGLIRWKMSMREESLVAFKAGLLLNLDAQLPVPASPELRDAFEGLREQVRRESRAQAGGQQAAQSDASARGHGGEEIPTDRPELQEQVLTPTSTPEPRPWLATPVQLGPMVVPKPTLALLGAGVVAGGVGSYFGLRSRGQLQGAHAVDFHDEMGARRAEGVRSARAANVLFGTAGVFVTSACLWWLFSSEEGKDMSGVGR